MKGKMNTDLGQILISPEVIAKYAGETAYECFGIVGMAMVSVKDGLVRLLKKDSSTKGINVVIDENNEKIKNASKNILKISALNKTGLEELYNKITEMFNLNEINLDNELLITNVRHKNIIEKAIQNVKIANEALLNGMPIDIITIYIKQILDDLGEITGDCVTEDIINEIFSKFCLGK